jgi:UDP-galactopyranose mutase
LNRLMRGLYEDEGIVCPVAWYYAPMSIEWTESLPAIAVVYDSMDELSAFRGAPRRLAENETRLFARADVVFTGGHSLYQAKRSRHANVHAFPSAVDAAHFARARSGLPERPEQAALPAPRIGWIGVIDERVSLDLLAAVARRRPNWSFVLVGPTAKIDPDALPSLPNLFWLGPKQYEDLPAFLAGWDVAIMPFALNDATRYISPTKTPEYLAAGKPVVSTSITDVVSPYGELGLARIADSPDAFIAAVDEALSETPESAAQRRSRADVYLADLSWDRTWSEMNAHVARAAEGRLNRV